VTLVNRIAASLVLAGFGVASFGVAAAAQSTSRAAIVHVTVIDVEHGRRIPDRTVMVRGTRIVAVSPGASADIPAGTRIVDGRGKYLIPGLWDMHVHVFSNVAHPGTDTHALTFPLMLANGVTGMRDMWTDLEDLKVLEGWRRDARRSDRSLLMPRIVPTSTALDGEPKTWPTSLVIVSPERARSVVDSLVDGGARTIKVLSPPRAAWLAIMDEARKRGVSVVGHVPDGVLPSEAAAAGQRSLEHFGGIPDECSAGAAEARRQESAVNPLVVDSAGVITHRRRSMPYKVQQVMVESYRDTLCATLAHVFVQNGTYLVPTAVLRTRRLLEFEPQRLTDPDFIYADPTDLAEWRALQSQAAAVTDSTAAAVRTRFVSHWIGLIGFMAHHGVPIMTGTDLGNPWVVAGFAVHDEMVLFARGGMTPSEVLRSATLAPAQFLGATDSLGTVAPGKVADLVLLDADPLSDVHNVARIRAVFTNGRYLDRAALDAMLSSVRQVTSERAQMMGGH